MIKRRDSNFALAFIMSKQRYVRRNLSDRQIQNGIDEWAQTKMRRGVDPQFWQWLIESPQGFAASVENFEKIRMAEMEKAVQFLSFPVECQAIQSLVSAAKRTIAPFPSRPGPQKFNHHHLLACVALRFYRDCSQATLMAYLKREFPYRLLIFGRAPQIPNWSTLYRFEQKLPPQDFARFLENLRPLNSALVDIIEMHRQMQVSLDSGLQVAPDFEEYHYGE